MRVFDGQCTNHLAITFHLDKDGADFTGVPNAFCNPGSKVSIY